MWIAVGVTAVGCYLAKLLGLSVPAGALERPPVRRLAALLPVALLAALTARQTSGGEGGAPVAAARAGGLAAALVLRAPFLVVVTAVLVTAGLRALGQPSRPVRPSAVGRGRPGGRILGVCV